MKFNKFISIGKNESRAASKVIASGKLSPFIGSWNFDSNLGGFYGGSNIKKFENKLSKLFNCKYAICVNSWTSGLVTALGALEIEPGDEVIVSPWTMCASATSILHWFAIPVFADINPKTFNLDPVSIEKNITNKTKAIIVPEIFGHPSDIFEIKKLAKKYKLKILSDNAQSILSKYNNKYSCTQYDVGGLSFNYHKHINTGEGGAILTNSKKIADKCFLIRNHGEAVVTQKKTKNIINIVGNNFRLGEIESAIGIEQLKKLNKIVKSRVKIAKLLTKGLSGLKGLVTPVVKKNCTHSFYIYGLILDKNFFKNERKEIINALKKRNVPVISGYQNIHLLSMFQKKIAFGSKGFPWKSEFYNKKISYKKGICPVAEELHDKYFIGLQLCNYDFNKKNITYIIETFKKIWKKY